MGNVAVTVLKKNQRPSGRAAIVRITFSNSYATGGDTVQRSATGLGNRLTAILGGAVTTPAGHAVEYVPAANEYTDPKLRVRDVATGAEIANATNLTAQSIICEVVASPYK